MGLSGGFAVRLGGEFFWMPNAVPVTGLVRHLFCSGVHGLFDFNAQPAAEMIAVESELSTAESRFQQCQ